MGACACACAHALHTWALATGLPGLASEQTTPTLGPPESPGVELVGGRPAYRFVCADGVDLGPKHH